MWHVRTCVPDSFRRPIARYVCKADFVNRVARFANRAQALPAVPAMPAVALAVAIIASIGGPFGTSALPMVERLAFWFLLMSIEAAKWMLWLGWQVRKREDYWRSALIGTPLLGLLIPLEIALSYRAIGHDASTDMLPVIANVGIVGAAILLAMFALHPPRMKQTRQKPDLLAREGLSSNDLLAASAEDHYCRLYLADGSQRLLHARLSDIVSLLEDAEGTQIHRSHWCADRGAVTARRAGRGWEILLPCGTALRVSATYRQEAQRRGWLSRGRSVA